MRWWTAGALACLPALAAEAGTLRVGGGALAVDSMLRADEVRVEADAVLRGTGTVAAAASIEGAVGPGAAAADSVGTLTFTDTLAFHAGSVYACYAATHTSLDRLVAAGAVGGTGQVHMTKAAAAVPLDQVIVDGGPGSAYDAFALGGASADDWELAAVGDDLQVTDLVGDSDSDGLPDWWEFDHFLDRVLAAAGDDDDTDTMSNREEYVADTDPNDDESVFTVSGEREGAEAFRLTWDAAARREYTIERRESLTNGSFTVIASGLGPVLPQNVYTDEVSSVTTYFYRVGVDLP